MQIIPANTGSRMQMAEYKITSAKLGHQSQ